MIRSTIKSLFILLLLVGLVSCSKYDKLLKTEDVTLLKKVGDDLFEKEKYDKALLFYEKILPLYVGSSQSEELFYRVGYSYFKLNDYPTAAFHFRNFVERFPGSVHEEDCYFNIAQCYVEESPVINLDQHNSRKAIEAFQLYLDKFPNSSKTDEINKKIDLMNSKIESKSYDNAYLYYKIEDYKSSVWAFKKFNLEYPGSQYNERADFYAIQSSFLLAEKSIETKQKERFVETIEHSTDFMEKYPKSKWFGKVNLLKQTASVLVYKMENPSAQKK